MKREHDDPIVCARHPFVYLVEAADDICYRIIDMEDAHRLGIMSKEIVSQAFLNIIDQVDRPEDDIDKIKDTFSKVLDDNDSIAYLRAKCINALTLESAAVFAAHSDEIIKGTYPSTLIDSIEENCQALADIIDLSVAKIYSHHSVVEIEITGYHVMSHLLKLFVPAVLRKKSKGTDLSLIHI